MLDDKTMISISTRNLYYNLVFKTETGDSSVTLSKAELDQYMQYFYDNSLYHGVSYQNIDDENQQVIFSTDHVVIGCHGAIEHFVDYIDLFQLPIVSTEESLTENGHSKTKQLEPR